MDFLTAIPVKRGGARQKHIGDNSYILYKYIYFYIYISILYINKHFFMYIYVYMHIRIYMNLYLVTIRRISDRNCLEGLQGRCNTQIQRPDAYSHFHRNASIVQSQ
jgi:hypothetical protein